MYKKNISPKHAAVMVEAVCGGATTVSQKSVTNLISPEISIKRPVLSRSILSALANFDELPDSAFVRQPVVMGLLSCSKATLWRWVKISRIPPPTKLGIRMSAWQVGPLRDCIRHLGTSDEISVSAKTG